MRRESENILLNHRCRICNKVSSQDIETNIGDFSKDYFIIENDRLGVVCLECEEVKIDLMNEYYFFDDPYKTFVFDDSNVNLEINEPENDPDIE